MTKYGMKLLIDSQTATIQPVKLGNGKIISPHTLMGKWLLIHVGIKIKQSW